MLALLALDFLLTWHNVDKHYTGADLRLTKGKTISKANRAHPPEASCLKDIIPRRAERVCIAKRQHSLTF